MPTVRCLLLALLATVLAAGEAQPCGGSLAPRDLITELAMAGKAYRADAASEAASGRAIMACVGLCVAGVRSEFAACGPWRDLAKTIAATRIAARGGTPASNWAAAMPELWVRLLDGRFAEVRQGLDAVAVADRDLAWRVLRAYATRDAGDLRRDDGPWATMALLWCDRLDPRTVSGPGIDSYQIGRVVYERDTVGGHDNEFAAWVADLAWMLQSVEIPDAEALALLHRLASALGCDSATAGRGALIAAIQRATRRRDLVTAPVISTCFDILDRGLAGRHGEPAGPAAVFGLGDVALWLADRSYWALIPLRNRTGRGSEASPLESDLLRTHDSWPAIARLRFSQDDPRLPGAEAGMVAAIERCLQPPQRLSPNRLLYFSRFLTGHDGIGPLATRIAALIDPDHPSVIAASAEWLASAGQAHVLAARLARAYAADDRDLNTVWYAAQVQPQELFPIPASGPTRAWIDATVDNTALPWPSLELREHFGIRWEGWVRAEIAGDHRFAITSDDGSELRVGETLVLNNGGHHAMQRREGAVHLDAGWHPLVLQFFQAGGGAGCRLEWRPPGSAIASVIPASALAHGPDRRPGLAARGYALAARDLGDRGIPELLARVAAEHPERLDLQSQICVLAVGSERWAEGLDAARRIAALAAEGRFGGEGIDADVAADACDSALTILFFALGERDEPDRAAVRALLRNLCTLARLPPGCEVIPQGRLLPIHQYHPGMRMGLRSQLYGHLCRYGFIREAETLAALQARSERDWGTDAQFEGLVALGIGDLRQAHELLTLLLDPRQIGRCGPDLGAESILEWALLERQFMAREPERARVEAAFKDYGPPPVYALAWRWIAGDATWTEITAQQEATHDGDVLLYLRGLYLITLGRFEDAKAPLEELCTRHPQWTESHKARALLAVLPRLGAAKLPVARPLANDGPEGAAPTRPAPSDF